jgi:hypothetical protein
MLRQARLRGAILFIGLKGQRRPRGGGDVDQAKDHDDRVFTASRRQRRQQEQRARTRVNRPANELLSAALGRSKAVERRIEKEHAGDAHPDRVSRRP